MNYKRIRGGKAKERCKNISVWGSPLYCECGCQIPIESDPILDLSQTVISRKSEEGYANFILSRKGIECGSYNSQYDNIYLDGNEFLGVDKETVAHLFAEVLTGKHQKKTPEMSFSAGSTMEETAAMEKMSENITLLEQDESHARHPGYCNKCHSYCYGDCTA